MNIYYRSFRLRGNANIKKSKKCDEVDQIYMFTRKIKDSHSKHEKLEWIEVNLDDSPSK